MFLHGGIINIPSGGFARCSGHCVSHSSCMETVLLSVAPTVYRYLLLGRFGPTAYLVIELLFRMGVYHSTIIHVHDGGVHSLGSYGALWGNWLPRRVAICARMFGLQRAEELLLEIVQRHALVCQSTSADSSVDPVRDSPAWVSERHC